MIHLHTAVNTAAFHGCICTSMQNIFLQGSFGLQPQVLCIHHDMHECQNVYHSASSGLAEA